MGCDIHLIVERRVDGIWRRVKELPPRPCSWCNGRGYYENRPERKCYWCCERQAETLGNETPGFDRLPYHDRNYNTFSVLADVRNDGNIKPISEPRGLPDDCTRAEGVNEYGENEAEYEYGDHSFSWLTLAELQAYDWKQGIQDEGWVDVETFAAWDAAGAKGAPKNWCSMVGGGSVEHVTNYEMRRYIAAGRKDIVDQMLGKRSRYTLIQWSESLVNYCKGFLDFMESLTALGAPEDVRIVFGFDS